MSDVDVKSGFASSEFWFHLAAVVVPAVAASVEGLLSPTVVGVLAALGALLSAQYSAHRTAVKVAAYDAKAQQLDEPEAPAVK